MVRCYILASMLNVLQHQHQSMPFAYDIMQNLKEMFGDQNCAARQTAIKELMNTTMFFLNYNMKKLSYSLAKLLKELQAVEGLIKKPTIDLVIEKGSSSMRKGQKK
ncbi:uncharacterized protein LOC131162584 [Malania oleifera]|uniref:uncharacterized protein LOC131162584 n=1 Tax=Malania oleifera TaxID=397392 RepID=UPI0025ADE9AC|nr:uncharacterized protein LOC131162584 [Malania oleifera]